jgi:hypothetical protein
MRRGLAHAALMLALLAPAAAQTLPCGAGGIETGVAAAEQDAAAATPQTFARHDLRGLAKATWQIAAHVAHAPSEAGAPAAMDFAGCPFATCSRPRGAIYGLTAVGSLLLQHAPDSFRKTARLIASPAGWHTLAAALARVATQATRDGAPAEHLSADRSGRPRPRS